MGMITLRVPEHFRTAAAKLASMDFFPRLKLAGNSKDPYELSLLANDDSASIRLNVAVNEITPQRVLEKLVRDDNLHVRQAAFENFTLEPSTLKSLSKTGDHTAELAKQEIARRKRLQSVRYRTGRLTRKLRMRLKWALRHRVHSLRRMLGLCPVCNGRDDPADWNYAAWEAS